MNPASPSPPASAKPALSALADQPEVPGGRAVLETYFARWREAFAQAGLPNQTGMSRGFALAGTEVRLRFVGDTLGPILTPALSHLPAGRPDRIPGLEVFCWSGVGTVARPPELPWRWPAQWRQSATYHPLGCKLFHVSMLSDSGDFVLYRSDTGQALVWVRDGRALAAQHYGAPLLALFATWAGGHGLMLVHAGCVGTDRGAVLLVGKGGSGKSTTCLLGAENGLDYLSDDYCLVGLTPGPTAYSLYCSGKLHRHMLPSFPRLAALAVDPGTDPTAKPVIFLRADHGYAVQSQRPLRAIVVPVVTGRPETTFEPTSAAQALLALAPSTLFQLPTTGTGSFQSLAQLVRVLPCFRLNLGTRFETVPPAIRTLLAGIP